jgi:hypothetical protein
MSTATFTIGGTFPPPRFAADTLDEAISAASDHQWREGPGYECEKDFLSAVYQELVSLLELGGINTAFVAKQLNTEPIQTRSPLRSSGPLYLGWTVGRTNTHSVTF